MQQILHAKILFSLLPNCCVTRLLQIVWVESWLYFTLLRARLTSCCTTSDTINKQIEASGVLFLLW